MIKKTKELLSDDKYRRMASNFSYLSVINIANKILPFIVIPYIVKTIGVEKYGVIVFAYAIMQYLLTITRYSFELTATKYISIHRDDSKKMSRYFWNVMATRGVLFLLGVMVLLPIIFGVERFSDEKEVFLFSLIFVFANDLIPLWFFQGVEDMKYIAIFNILTKIVYAIAIFAVVQVQSDYIYVPLLNALSFLAVGIYSIYFVVTRYDIGFVLPSVNEMIALLKEGKDIFFSNISVSFYSTMNTVLLGLMTNYTAVGIYGLAETIFSAYNVIIRTYATVIYPHLARYAEQTKELYAMAHKFFKLYMVILVVASIFLYLISDFAIVLLFGEGHAESIIILKILALSLMIAPLGGFFTRYMTIKDAHKTIRKITFQTMLVNFIIIFPFIFFWRERGVAMAILFLAIVQAYLNIKHNKEVLTGRKAS